jgi:cleavage stimulation factor subunit 3
MELANNELRRVEQIFQRCILPVLSVEICSLYLDYIRRINNLATDAGGRARTIIAQAYEFVLNHVGIDKESSRIWQDYIAFIKSGPGTVGGTGWQDQQKMDHLRKVYQRVICIPIQGVDQLWREYDQFEMSLNKLTVSTPILIALCFSNLIIRAGNSLRRSRHIT